MTESANDPEDTFFSGLRRPIEEAVERLISEKNIDTEQVEKILRDFISDGAPSLAERLNNGTPNLLKGEKLLNSSFKARHLDRWEAPLHLLKTMWRCSLVAGQSHAHSGAPEDADPIVFDTLCILHPKALLITSEIICLLEAGYADGALARWRALHEVAVTAIFIASHDGATARDYRLSGLCSDLKAAKSANEYSDRNQMEPVPEAELNRMELACAAAERKAGRRFKHDLDWAKPALKKDGKQHATFFDLEKDIGMDHWRPRFKWACQHNHAGFTHPNSLLGMAEATQLMHQVGPSNSGLTDPLDMTAISLFQMTTAFLFVGQPCIGRVMFIAAMECLSDQLRDAALASQELRPA